MKCNDWIAVDFKITVVEDKHRPIIRRDLFSQLGPSLNQSTLTLKVKQNQCQFKSQRRINFT